MRGSDGAGSSITAPPAGRAKGRDTTKVKGKFWWHYEDEIISSIFNLIGNRRGGLRPAKFRDEQ